MARLRVLGGVILLAFVAACQAPAGPQGSAPPDGSPLAPAEPSHPRPDRTLMLPSASAVAPAIEPQPTGPDPTVELPDDLDLPGTAAPVAPAIEPERGDAAPTKDPTPN